MSAVKDCLTRARSVLVERGWCQGAFARDGHVCALGALAVAGDPGDNARAVLRAVVGPNVADWNDRTGRTADQVLAAFDKAIEISL